MRTLFSPERRQAGLTLIETLITMALGLLILTAAYSLTQSTGQASALLTARTQLRGDALISTQLLAARLREACAVYPQGTSLTLPAVSGTRNAAGTTTWRAGTNFVAVIVPPRSTDSSDLPTLFAYYLLPRGTYNAQMPAQQKISAAGNAQALMEFRVPLSSATNPCSTPLGVSLTATGARALLLSDDVRTPQAAEPVFTVETDSAVSFRLRFAKQVGSQEAVYPPLGQAPVRAAVVGRNVR
ncbi:prepilin-type N-terminal cleavage/methylation domain-containing protein [Deinococcus taeanensis]|uniref:PilW family protein n=1 Tax=Deinococcus taeanensis TaxID=2737050 RepID=UPI001CDBAE5E|nr:prepilin-type N-terminal cleavage/methylation domain-containing protein [Deinococcus taeanensis]UBV42651.1 prepilin-type N-terminal cleavage/methylation domain-containing protein [Deinococcus taeanensis]